MATLVAHSRASPLICHIQSQESTKQQPSRSVKMTQTFLATELRLENKFSGFSSFHTWHEKLVNEMSRSLILPSLSWRKCDRSRDVSTKAMFERFTETAVKSIMLAQEEARSHGHNFVGTEQMLLGLIGEKTGIASKFLESMGINLEDARVEVEKISGRGSGFLVNEIPFTPRAKRLFELSLEESRQLGHNYIASEHLLLGLLREGDGAAARVLENLGADSTKFFRKLDILVTEIEKSKRKYKY